MSEDGIEIYYLSDEDVARMRDRILNEIKSQPEWYNLLADCHLKCSDFTPFSLNYDAAMWLTPEDQAELYAEAERIRNGGA